MENMLTDRADESGSGGRLGERRFKALREILRDNPCAEARRLMAMGRAEVLREIDERANRS